MEAEISVAADPGHHPANMALDQIQGPISQYFNDKQGGVHLALEDHDKLFNNLSNPPILVNDIARR